MKEFFHGSYNIQYLKSFVHNGAQPIGCGEGGQEQGFYVFESKKLAINHLYFLKNNKKRLSDQGGMIVGIKIKEEDLKYPDWQFDYEALADVSPLLEKYAASVIKTLLQIETQTLKILSARKTPRFGRFEVHYKQKGKLIQKMISPVDPGNTGFIGVWQKTFDALCNNNPSFKKDYDDLLLDSPLACKKYTGFYSLPISYLSYMQPQPDGSLKEIVLYTDEQPKEKQSCPFLKTLLAQASLKRPQKSIEK